MKYLACQNENCLNYNSPYTEKETNEELINCPVCNEKMGEIPKPIEEPFVVEHVPFVTDISVPILPGERHGNAG